MSGGVTLGSCRHVSSGTCTVSVGCTAGCWPQGLRPPHLYILPCAVVLIPGPSAVQAGQVEDVLHATAAHTQRQHDCRGMQMGRPNWLHRPAASIRDPPVDQSAEARFRGSWPAWPGGWLHQPGTCRRCPRRCSPATCPASACSSPPLLPRQPPAQLGSIVQRCVCVARPCGRGAMAPACTQQDPAWRVPAPTCCPAVYTCVATRGYTKMNSSCGRGAARQLCCRSVKQPVRAAAVRPHQCDVDGGEAQQLPSRRQLAGARPLHRLLDCGPDGFQLLHSSHFAPVHGAVLGTC
jgi:hypothetical protein